MYADAAESPNRGFLPRLILRYVPPRAGLGGCIMVLVRTDALNALLHRLKDDFYAPRMLPFDVHVCLPVSGADLLRI